MLFHVLPGQSKLLGQHAFSISAFRILRARQQTGFVDELKRSEIGNTRTHAQDFLILLPEGRDILRHLRARPDQTHLALEYVDKLRQLVDLSAPQQASHSGDARILADSDGEAELRRLLKDRKSTRLNSSHPSI